MLSLNGFLAPRGPGERPRLTDRQIEGVLKAVHTIMGAVPDGLVEAATDYPVDRSCHSCDFLHGSFCRQWGDTVPTKALEAGCERWRDDGAPF